MIISFVIPTRNRAKLLNQTLHYLGSQNCPPHVSIEVVVVDDGSNDTTTTVVEAHRSTMSYLTYIYLEKDQNAPFSPSKTRNIGIQHSSGNIIVFLDCGVLVNPQFTKLVAQRYIATHNLVLIHYTFGLFVDPTSEDVALLDTLTPVDMDQIVQHLLSSPAWCDTRVGLFNLVDDHLDRLPAPWALGWSCAMTVPRNLLIHTGGFDETFQGWGSEDTDLAYRLYRSGASFMATRDCFALHIPHPIEANKDKIASNIQNRKWLHQKFYTLDTELYPLYPGPYYNQVLVRLNHLVISDIIPQYQQAMLQTIRSEYMSASAKTLLVGTDNSNVVRDINPSHVLVHNHALHNRFCRDFPEKDVRSLLGCDTPFPAGFFDMAVVTDLLRSFSEQIQSKMLEELTRIALRVGIIYTEGFISVANELDGLPWSTYEQLAVLVQHQGLNLQCQRIGGQQILLVVTAV